MDDEISKSQRFTATASFEGRFVELSSLVRDRWDRAGKSHVDSPFFTLHVPRSRKFPRLFFAGRGLAVPRFCAGVPRWEKRSAVAPIVNAQRWIEASTNVPTMSASKTKVAA